MIMQQPGRHMDDGMSDVLGMTENDYYQITNYFIR